MARSPSTDSIAISIGQFMGKIKERVSNSILHGPPTDDDFLRWQQQVDLYIRHLRQVEGRLNARESRIRSVPRDQRFREQQSIDDSRDSVARAGRRAFEARLYLWQLTKGIPVPPDVKLINESFDHIDDMLKEYAELEKLFEQMKTEGIADAAQTQQLMQSIKQDVAKYEKLNVPEASLTDSLLVISMLLRILILSWQHRKD